jgi:hypothetical protein
VVAGNDQIGQESACADQEQGALYNQSPGHATPSGELNPMGPRVERLSTKGTPPSFSFVAWGSASKKIGTAEGPQKADVGRLRVHYIVEIITENRFLVNRKKGCAGGRLGVSIPISS